jgi:hypothetical protein
MDFGGALHVMLGGGKVYRLVSHATLPVAMPRLLIWLIFAALAALAWLAVIAFIVFTIINTP